MSFVDLPARLNIDHRFLGARVEEGNGDRPALRTDLGTWTYGEVDDLARAYGVALRGIGVVPEQRVLIALPDGPDYVGALFGILKIGAVAVMVNPDLTPESLGGIIGRARAPVALVHHTCAAAFEEAVGRAGWPTQLVVVAGETPGHVSLTDLDRNGPCPRADTHRDDPAIWLFSGGTTGAPKAVPQTHRSFANTTALYTAAVGFRPDDVTMAVPKLFFGYATGANLFFPFSVGATATLFPERPTPDTLFDKIEAHRPSILVHVPSSINQMLAHPRAATADLSSLRFVTSAGEALPETLYRAWVDRFGVEILDGLGTAEMWHIFVTNHPGQVRPGTLGNAIEGFEVSVRDDDGLTVADGEVGRLWVKGDSRGLGYWQDLDATAETFRGEWVVTGDLVSRDADGFFTHRGRVDDAVKIKGKWFSPSELEGCLLEHPAVADVAVVPVEDETGLLTPVAFVVAAAEVEAEELVAWSLDRLEPYKHPRRVVFLDELPHTHLGKVDRGGLRRSLREHSG